jgi:hypothetical protein
MWALAPTTTYETKIMAVAAPGGWQNKSPDTGSAWLVIERTVDL